MLRKTYATAATILVPLIGYELRISYIRSDGEKRRSKPFPEGSTEASLMDALSSGDIILFRRAWYDYRTPAAMLIALHKKVCGVTFDHAGIVVESRQGTPYLLETTFSGTKLRPYEHRILSSEAKDILLVPTKPRIDLSNDQRSALFDYASKYATTQTCDTNEGQTLARYVYNRAVVKYFGKGDDRTEAVGCPSSRPVTAILRYIQEEGQARTASKSQSHKEIHNHLKDNVFDCDDFSDSVKATRVATSLGLSHSFGEAIVVDSRR